LEGSPVVVPAAAAAEELQHPLRVRCVSLTRGWNLAVLPWSAADPYQSPEIFRFFYDTQRRKRETEQRTQWKRTLPQSPVHNASAQQKIVASNGCKCSPRTHRRDCARARKSSCKNLDITYMVSDAACSAARFACEHRGSVRSDTARWIPCALCQWHKKVPRPWGYRRARTR